jgi:O-antigen/teichoic acid export membrane protein
MMHRYLLLSGGLAAAVFLVAPVLIRRLLFGASYAALDTLLPWFGLVIFLRYASTTYGAAITAVGAQRSRTLALLGAAAISLAADFWLIPRVGLPGALAASVSTQLVVLLLYAGLTRRYVGGWLIDQRAATGLAVLALMGGFAWRLSVLAPHIVAILGPVVLAAFTVALAIPSTEWRRLRQAVRGAPAAATYGT